MYSLAWAVMYAANFTFQSGSIQINTSNDNKLNVNGFTFQSGSIQMIYAASGTYVCSVFTFQSGSIQILRPFEYLTILV